MICRKKEGAGQLSERSYFHIKHQRILSELSNNNNKKINSFVLIISDRIYVVVIISKFIIHKSLLEIVKTPLLKI